MVSRNLTSIVEKKSKEKVSNYYSDLNEKSRESEFMSDNFYLVTDIKCT